MSTSTGLLLKVQCNESNFLQCESKKEVVPRVCVGLVLIAVLLILMALVLTYVDWEINMELPDNNSTISEQWTSKQNE